MHLTSFVMRGALGQSAVQNVPLGWWCVLLGLQGREGELVFYLLLMVNLYSGARERPQHKCYLKFIDIFKPAKLDL